MPLSVSPSVLQEVEELLVRVPFKPSSFNLLEDSKRRVRTALDRAYVVRFNEGFVSLFEAVKTVANHPDTEGSQVILNRAMEQLDRATSDCRELRRWVYPPVKPMTLEQAAAVLPSLQQSGWDIKSSLEIIAAVQKRRAGAPAKKRQLYVDAFERMLRPRALSLGRVMKELCDCGSETHSGCTKSFQAGIGSVKKLLRKYVPGLVSEYDELHPDRARINRKPHHKSMAR